jgi:hypothetical protein
MKQNKASRNQPNAKRGSSFKSTCIASCQKILAQIAKAKTTIYNEWRGAVGTQERLLQLALNEAEATAWQTRFPHLIFPVLAAEKAENVVNWNLHQRAVRRRNPSSVLAARWLH